MKIVFASRRLEACFVDAKAAARMWGPVVGRRYIQRVQMLKHMTTEDVHGSGSLRAHPLHGAKSGRLALNLHDRWRMEVTFEGDILRIEEVSNHYGD